jgi:hypothetical protein
MGGTGVVRRPQRGRWDPDPSDFDEAEAAMFSIASGDVDETWTADWLRQRIRFHSTD